MREVVYKGTEMKLNISIEPVDTLTMDDYSFDCIFHTVGKSLTISKREMIRKDENNYIAIINSNELDYGLIKMKIIAQLPDADAEKGQRTEVLCMDTNIYLQPCNA